MPRYEKGILGVRKDPKNKILISFGVTKGSEEWPSDDSSDSDFEPFGYEEPKPPRKQKSKRKRQAVVSSDEDSDYQPESTTVKKAKVTQNVGSKKEKSIKRTGTKKPPLKEKKNISSAPVQSKKAIKANNVSHGRTNKSDERINIRGDNIWGAKIPPEVLTKIFLHVVEQNGSLPFLARAARVCQLWSIVASDLTLWRNVDLSYGWIKRTDTWLRWLCDNRLAETRSLDLSGWGKVIKDDQLNYIAEKCPHLEEVTLKGCTKVSADSVHRLASTCLHLHSLDLSHEENQQNVRLKADFAMAKHLNTLIDKMGPRLQKLNLANHSLANFNVVLKSISHTCGSLRELDLSGVKFSSDYLSMDIPALQKGCPRLTALRLNCAMIRPASTLSTPGESVGWDDLEELQIGTWNQSYTGISDSTLQSLLGTSQKLRLLNIRGCKSLTGRVLSDLCCLDLEQLYMTWTKIPTATNMADVFKKWNHSLQELDVGWCGSYCGNFSQSLSALTHPNSRLHTLDLSGSTINMAALRGLLSGCQRITTLAVSSCRSLEPCYKRRYSDKREIQTLRNKLRG